MKLIIDNTARCAKCGHVFKLPRGLPRRRVCAKCIANRPGHLRDKTDNAGSTAAAVKRGQAVTAKPNRTADRFSFVSVGYEPLTEAQLAAMVADFDRQWRERNVIPFDRNRVKPPTRPFKPFNGGKAA